MNIYILKYFFYSGSFTSIVDGGKNKTCLAACEGQTYQVTSSNSMFPVPSTFSLSPMFCKVVKKIELACQDERKDTMEVVYPRICENIHIVQSNNACAIEFNPINITDWTKEQQREFSHLILKYTKENILMVNIYMKDPFAVKYIIEANSPKSVILS